ncbi:ABC transporter ATP-binding protein [Fulvimarina endophytica]|uniref:ABC transporter ATP-binding protein n=1 Tax=Fulvimarina endophytica TaxID=2293836 RepID=A0A371WYG6_9HYPH|nr:ABC transporter ATP-binding protein [Fulvimarina endophytica]RFC62023.1 ABC transporter ATP-binding protein [Fulvimarina endophytica]
MVGGGEIALEASGLGFSAGGRTILQGVDCRLTKGRILALLGPNGSGKSTLMRLLARLERPNAGTLRLEGQPAETFSGREMGRRIAFLPQNMQTPPALRVRDLVACGRYPHRSAWRRESDADRTAIAAALEATDLEPLAERPVGNLSGGERQRALIAMALAQETAILMLDEPTTYLDLRFQLQILDLVRRLNRERGLTVCWVLHDLNQAAAYSDGVVVMADGRCVASGAPDETLTPELVASVFGVEILRLPHPASGRPISVPARFPAPFCDQRGAP